MLSSALRYFEELDKEQSRRREVSLKLSADQSRTQNEKITPRNGQEETLEASRVSSLDKLTTANRELSQTKRDLEEARKELEDLRKRLIKDQSYAKEILKQNEELKRKYFASVSTHQMLQQQI